MSKAQACDGPGCDTWAKEGPMTDDWLTVMWRADVWHFCCGDCLMKWAASWSEPTVVIA